MPTIKTVKNMIKMVSKTTPDALIGQQKAYLLKSLKLGEMSYAKDGKYISMRKNWRELEEF